MSSATSQNLRPVGLVYVAISVVLCVLPAILYLPFRSSPFVFDDLNIYRWPLSYYATTPIGLALRLPSYFSIAFVETIWGQIEVHRLVGLTLHIATGLLLYRVLLQLVAGLRTVDERRGAGPDLRTHVPAAAVAAWFTIHPAGVYAAGYLIQRSVVLATLFSLLALYFFLRGVIAGRYTDAVTAAALSSLAMLSREHAVMFPAVALASLFVARKQWPFALRYGALYAALCLPIALLVLMLSKQYILTPFELQYDSFVKQVVDDSAPPPVWIDSVATQTSLFFRYVGTWLWPRLAAMSVDARADLLMGQPTFSGVASIVAFAAAGIAALVLLVRGHGMMRLAALGFLYGWLHFIVDMSTVRLQEPFVIYRSYLWAPGVAIMVVALMQRLPVKVQAVAFVAIGSLLFYQAHDRLTTFSHPLLLWEDAAAKLPPQPILGDARIYSNLAREYVLVGRADDAIATIARCNRFYPDYYQCTFARGAIHLFREDREEYDLATQWLERAVALRPDSALAHHHLGRAYEKQGMEDAARHQYGEASKLGFIGGDLRQQLMESTTGTITLFRRDKTNNAR